MAIPRMSRLLRKGKAMLLSYDQGLEQGPSAFDERSVDPINALDLALEGGYTGIILHAGVAEKYYHGAYREVPLVVKLNGKTNLAHIDPISRQVCSVARAVKLGADAVGYTIYDGSKAEPEMFQEFGRIVEEAHDHGIPVIAWMYPRGKNVQHESSPELLAYSARIGLELGADMVKLHYNGDLAHLKWVKRCAGRAGVILSENRQQEARAYLQEVYETVVEADCMGIAVGRELWASKRPFSLSKAIGEIVYRRKRPEEVMHLLK